MVNPLKEQTFLYLSYDGGSDTMDSEPSLSSTEAKDETQIEVESAIEDVENLEEADFAKLYDEIIEQEARPDLEKLVSLFTPEQAEVLQNLIKELAAHSDKNHAELIAKVGEVVEALKKEQQAEAQREQEAKILEEKRLAEEEKRKLEERIQELVDQKALLEQQVENALSLPEYPTPQDGTFEAVFCVMIQQLLEGNKGMLAIDPKIMGTLAGTFSRIQEFVSAVDQLSKSSTELSDRLSNAEESLHFHQEVLPSSLPEFDLISTAPVVWNRGQQLFLEIQDSDIYSRERKKFKLSPEDIKKLELFIALGRLLLNYGLISFTPPKYNQLGLLDEFRSWFDEINIGDVNHVIPRVQVDTDKEGKITRSVIYDVQKRAMPFVLGKDWKLNTDAEKLQTVSAVWYWLLTQIHDSPLSEQDTQIPQQKPESSYKSFTKEQLKRITLEIEHISNEQVKSFRIHRLIHLFRVLSSTQLDGVEFKLDATQWIETEKDVISMLKLDQNGNGTKKHLHFVVNYETSMKASLALVELRALLFPVEKPTDTQTMSKTRRTFFGGNN